MKLIQELKEKSRANKHSNFMKFCNPDKTTTILDVGITDTEYEPTDNYLEKHYPFLNRITALGLGNLSKFKRRYPKINVVSYNGGHFPFKNNQFDVVWSNAVIEHVGNAKKQHLFLSEMIRVAKRKVVFNTPNKMFPVELHTKSVLLHWLPKKLADKCYMIIGKEWAANDYMHLLLRKDLENLIKKCSKTFHFNYKIIGTPKLCPITYRVMIEKR